VEQLPKPATIITKSPTADTFALDSWGCEKDNGRINVGRQNRNKIAALNGGIAWKVDIKVYIAP
jgi:hypothetical protein